jgi:hypothetical protein
VLVSKNFVLLGISGGLEGLGLSCSSAAIFSFNSHQLSAQVDVM